jgi:hypothetical protein
MFQKSCQPRCPRRCARSYAAALATIRGGLLLLGLTVNWHVNSFAVRFAAFVVDRAFVVGVNG